MPDYTKTEKPNEVKEKHNIKCKELQDEFIDHVKAISKDHPEYSIDKLNTVFQGWAIQKIAGLQLALYELVAQLNIQFKDKKEEK